MALDALEVSVESAIDLNGFLQLRPTHAGLDGVRVAVHVRSDADDETLEAIRKIVTKASPVYDSVARPVAIESAIQRI